MGCSWTCYSIASLKPAHQHHLISNSHLHEPVTRFWDVEEVPSTHQESLSAEEAECEAHFISTHSRDSSGRYIVRLPFKSNAPPLGHSKGIAQRSLARLLNRLSHQPELHRLYQDFLNEYESMGHMEKVQPQNTSTDGYYLPHYGVMRNNKIRVVFNGSSKTTSGYTVNDLLHTGPKTQNDIFDVQLYVRRHHYIFTTDVEYELTTVTYGTKPAPYLSDRALQQLLLDEGHLFPLAKEPFEQGSYVDDITGGADDLDSLNAIATLVEEMCLRGCFPLSKWKSNHPDFFKLHSSPSSCSETHEFSESSSKIVGLAWQCAPDLLKFTDQSVQRPAISKHTILSETAQLFDPLGLISPVVVRAKVLMQDLWQEKVGDDQLTPQIIHRWTTFCQKLSQLSLLAIPRWLQLRSDDTEVEIHGFSTHH
ncbi:uncharacterized protein LOC124187044 [Neodiprion fabricii]|uniref:uncharacterized protein LOC124187044 n=1 Tax=Neodiprion fabricii TaxID=2872261 RepID=UPI001ED8E2D2|nr:uncharacterized protein LOC124187044 [Neodiprion fabricii]